MVRRPPSNYYGGGGGREQYGAPPRGADPYGSYYSRMPSKDLIVCDTLVYGMWCMTYDFHSLVPSPTPSFSSLAVQKSGEGLVHFLT